LTKVLSLEGNWRRHVGGVILMDMQQYLDKLKALHTLLIDSRNGYDEAFADAEGKGMSSLFRDMMAFHQHSAEALGAYLKSYGEIVDDQGSYMTTVNRTVITIRSLFGGLDETIIPGLVDGELRIAAHYDDVIAACPADAAEFPVLAAQRDNLQGKIDQMRSQTAAPA
jgi:uncharacterized protein (TIGR02284 family)